MSDGKNTRQSSPGFMPGPGGGGPGGGGGPSARFQREKQSAKDSRRTLRRLWGYLKHQKAGLLLVMAMVGIASLQSMIGPYLLSRAIDDYIIPGDVRGLVLLCLGMLALYIVVSVASWFQTWLMVGISQRTLRNMRQELFGKLQTLDLQFFDSRSRGEIMSRVTNDIENISNVMTQSVTQFLSSVISIIGVVVMMFVLSWPLALIAMVTVPPIIWFSKYVGARTRKTFKQQQKELGTLNGLIEETITGQRVIKLFCREEIVIDQFDDINANLKRTSIKAQILAGLMGPSMNLLNNVRYAVVAGAGAALALNGVLTIGIIAAFLNYTRQFGRPLNMIAQLYNSIQSALAGAERVFEIIDEVPKLIEKPDALPLTEIEGHVHFEKVDFGYLKDVPVLKQVDLDALPGLIVALVGPTGAGKTTIVNLLTRFYDIDSGSITIDGRDIRDYRIDDLRRRLGIVLQDTFLFSDSVVENIRYGRLDATDEEVFEAAKLANADYFIKHLPDGYQTLLSEEGNNLSQGQKQLIAIARAILADPAILILDEATSSVDTRTEMLIQEGMLKLMEGRTSFVIAHRLSTIRDADQILVIRDGEIVEHGNHSELIEKRGLYFELHTSHFETEIIETDASR